MDWGNRRTSLFSKEGEYLQSCKWPAPRLRVYLTTDSSFTTDEMVFGKKIKLHIKTFDFSCKELIDYGEFTPMKFTFNFQGNMTYGGFVPYSPKSIFAGDQQRNWLYHCLNDHYAIEVYNQNGQLFRKIDRPYKPLPFTSKDAEAFFSQLSKNPNKIFIQMAKEMELPKVKTVTEYMIVDDQGNLWVELNEKKVKDGKLFTAYDIFDKDGLYIARVWSDVRPRLFVRGKMYSLIVDEETGFRTVRRYKVVWSKTS